LINSAIMGGYANCFYGTSSSSTIGGGQYNCFANGVSNAIIGGGFNNRGYDATNAIIGGSNNIASGTGNVIGGGCNNSTGGGSYNYILGGCSNNQNGYGQGGIVGGNYRTQYASNYACFQYLSKAGGYFSIPHPDPAKTKTYELRHSFVESPTEGDNLYRYVVKTCNCKATLELPDYFKYLNKNETIKIAPVNHFGKAYGEIDPTQSCVDFTSNFDGEYNVLIFGTRKDEAAEMYWKGVEQIKAPSEVFIGHEGR